MGQAWPSCKQPQLLWSWAQHCRPHKSPPGRQGEEGERRRRGKWREEERLQRERRRERREKRENRKNMRSAHRGGSRTEQVKERMDTHTHTHNLGKGQSKGLRKGAPFSPPHCTFFRPERLSALQDSGCRWDFLPQEAGSPVAPWRPQLLLQPLQAPAQQAGPPLPAPQAAPPCSAFLAVSEAPDAPSPATHSCSSSPPHPASPSHSTPLFLPQCSVNH